MYAIRSYYEFSIPPCFGIERVVIVVEYSDIGSQLGIVIDLDRTARREYHPGQADMASYPDVPLV